MRPSKTEFGIDKTHLGVELSEVWTTAGADGPNEAAAPQFTVAVMRQHHLPIGGAVVQSNPF